MNRQRTSGAAESIVAESIPSWNQIGIWMQELNALKALVESPATRSSR
jgi:hypothetical protein